MGHDLLVLPSAAVAIYDAEGNVLVGLHSDRRVWVLPGGLIEPGETPGDGAVRETWEETGLVVELTGIIGVYGGRELVVDYANGDRASYVGTIFQGRIIGGQIRADGDEILELRYVSKDELQSLPHALWIDVAIDAIYQRGGTPHFQPPTWHP